MKSFVAVVLVLCASAQGVVFEDLDECQDRYQDYRDAYSECRDEIDSVYDNVSLLNLSCLDQVGAVHLLSYSLNESLNVSGSYAVNTSLLAAERDSCLLNLSALNQSCTANTGLSERVTNLTAEVQSRSEELNACENRVLEVSNQLLRTDGSLQAYNRSVEDLSRKVKIGCPDPKTAVTMYYEKWRGLSAKGRDCLPRILALEPFERLYAANILTQTCNLTIKEDLLGPTASTELRAIWKEYYNRGFLLASKESPLVEPVDIGGVGCISLFEDKENQSRSDQLDAALSTMVICGAVSGMFFVGYKWNRHRKYVKEGKV
jgi:hypothetical protein